LRAPPRSARGPRRGRSSRASAEDRHAGALERHGELERRLAAELHDHAVGLLALDDREHVLERQRLEVELVDGVVVGADRLRVAVDHDRLEAVLASAKRACTQQ
jgi:hypothetical protein